MDGKANAGGLPPPPDAADLTVEDYQAVLAVYEKISSCDTLERLRQTAIDETASLIESLSCAWTEVNTTSGLTYGTMNTPVDPGRISQEMARVVHQHPVINHFKQTGDGSPRAISDFLGRRRFRSLDLYLNFYRGYGTEDQLSIAHNFGDEWIVGLVLNRNSWGFDDRDRAVLGALRPVFFSTYNRMKIHAELSLAAKGIPSESAQISLLRSSLRDRGLSSREAEVLAWIVEGKSNPEIAEQLNLSVGTVRKHVERVFAQLNVSNRAAATRAALLRIREGLDPS